jgi:membrane protein DedA with SNARE-associated domain
VFQHWIERFGPWAVFIGLMTEGEMALIIAGYALHHGYLQLLPTLLLGTAGGTCTDSLYYWLGRSYGIRILRSRPKLRPLRARAVLLLRRYGHLMALGVRFAFGLRIALPIAMGSARMRPRVFHLYNAIGAFLFAVVYLGIGYGLGTVFRRLIAQADTEDYALAGMLALGALVWIVNEWRIYHATPLETRNGWRLLRRRPR